MNYRLYSVRIKNFRGIRDLYLPLRGKNLIVVGENGTGKSSIVDAFEYTFKHRVDKLTGRKELNQTRNLPFINICEKPKTKLETIDSSGTIETVEVTFPHKHQNLPRGLERFLNLAGDCNFILRRSQILRFIEAKGAERYQQMSSLVGLDLLDNIDKAWRKHLNDLKKERKQLEELLKATLDEAGEIFSSRVNAEQDFINLINNELQSLAIAPIKRRTDLSGSVHRLKENLMPEQEESDEHSLLRSSLQLINDIDGQAANAITKTENLISTWLDYQTKLQALGEAELEKVLIEGRKILLDQTNRKTCPLCEAEIPDLSRLLTRLEQRLNQLNQLTLSRKKHENACSQTNISLGSLRDKLKEITDLPKAFIRKSNLTNINKTIQEIDDWLLEISNDKRVPISLQNREKNTAFSQLRNNLAEVRALIQKRISILSSSIENQKKLESLLKLSRAEQKWKEIEQCQRDLDQACYITRHFEAIYNQLVRARKSGFRKIQNSIKEDLEKFYCELHPDDEIVRVRLPVSSNYNSIDLKATFYEEEAHPLNYFSEGHLDSLGLCIFLAFIRRFNEDLNLIILDDVLTTIDAGHRIRVARLLANEFADTQIIITTHDRLWGEQLNKILPNSHMTCLKPWTLDIGADVQEYVPTWDHYRQLAKAGRPADAIAGTGRCFEKFLYEMRKRLSLAVPAKQNDDYTIGDLYGPFFRWIEKYRPERPDRPDFAQEIKKRQERLDHVWRLRNWSGAHFNPWGEYVSLNEALSFIDEIEQLVNSFECPKCHELIVYNHQIGVLHCPNCRPSPPPKIVWEYEIDWGKRAERRLEIPREEARNGAVIEAQKAFERFLSDVRRIYPLTIQATVDDEYDLSKLYEPFVTWTRNHPPVQSDNTIIIEELIQTIDSRLNAGIWQPVPDEERDDFVKAIRVLTSLYHCPDGCGRLLAYDHESDKYCCPSQHDGTSQVTPVAALWFVKQA